MGGREMKSGGGDGSSGKSGGGGGTRHIDDCEVRPVADKHTDTDQ